MTVGVGRFSKLAGVGLPIERLLLVAALVLLGACTGSPEDPAATFERATQALREGRSAEAAALARDGAERWGKSDATWRWRFRYLEAEGHLYAQQPAEAAALLQEPLPAESRFDTLRIRHAYLEAYSRLRGKEAAAGLAALPAIAEQAEELGLLDLSLEALTLRAQSFLRQNQFAAADELLLDALARSTDAVAYQRGVILFNLGTSRQIRNRFDEALTYFERLLGDRSLESTLVYRAALGNAGFCYSRLGNLERAVAAQQRAVESHERAGSDQFLQQSMGQLGITLMLQGDSSQGLTRLGRALEIATASKQTADAATWAGNLAIAHTELEHWHEAERFNNLAIDLRKATGSSRLVYHTYTSARIASGRGRMPEAIAKYNETIRLATGDAYIGWVAHAGLADIYRQSGNLQRAIAHYEEALNTIERTRTELISREYRLTFLSQLIRFHQDYVEALMAHGRVERALEVAESSRARVLAERQGVAQAGRVPASAFVKLADRTQSTLLSYWLAPARSFVWIITGDGIRAVTLPPRDEIATLVRDYRDFVTVSLADPLASSSTPGHRLTDILLNPLSPTLSPPHPDPLPLPGGEGGKGRGAGEARAVVIVADDALHGLSFDMLPIASPEPHYWIEDVTVTMAPSLALAAEAPTQRAARANDPPADRAVLLVGDPTHVDRELPPLTFAGAELSGIARAFGGKTETLRGAGATPSAVAAQQLQRYGLIHFAAHATASAESPLDSAILLSPEQELGTAKAVPSISGGREPHATSLQASGPPSLQASRGEAQAASMAQGPKPQDASLRYKLYARDVVSLPLTADVVTLSACRSAGGRAYGGEGLVGFAWAFLRAGARQVVAGLWDVDDQSTALLMERFYARLGAGASPAAALRDAKLSLLHSNGNFRKPYYWAAFAVFSSSLDSR